MAQNVKINGVTYESVPRVEIPFATGSGSAVFVDTGSGDAAAGDIRSGKKAWVDGAEVTGSLPVKSASDVTVSGKKVTAPAGVYDSAVEKSVADGAVTPGADVSGTVLGTAASDYPVEITPKATVGTAGYVSSVGNGAKITRYVQVEAKTATPSTAKQTITPSSGKLLKSVEVGAVDVTATATAADVVSGKTFFAGNLTKKTGTATFPTVAQDSTSKVLTIS